MSETSSDDNSEFEIASPEMEVKQENVLSEVDSGSETEDLSSGYEDDDQVPSLSVKSESQNSSEVETDTEFYQEATHSDCIGKIKIKPEKQEDLLDDVKDKEEHFKTLEEENLESEDWEEESMMFIGDQDEDEVKRKKKGKKSKANSHKKSRPKAKLADKKTLPKSKKKLSMKRKDKKIRQEEKGVKYIKNKVKKCQYCGKLCQSRNRLEIHWKVKHEEEKPFTCDRCDETFHTKQEARKHRWSVHPRPDGWYLCQFCEKSFNKKSNLVTHERTHTGEKPFVCDQCGKGFSLNSSLKRHADVHVTEEERGGFKCEICFKEFATAMRRKRHYITHKTERDHPCEVCGKAFTQTSSLTVHMKTHFAERTFHCPYCPKAFTRGQHLKKHLKHAKNLAALKIRCRLCDANFPCSGALTVHMNSHEQYIQKKIFACDICNKKFARKVELRRHSVTHIEYDDLPYQCPVCDKRFGRNDTYSNHMKNVHPVENALQKALQESTSDKKPVSQKGKKHKLSTMVQERKFSNSEPDEVKAGGEKSEKMNADGDIEHQNEQLPCVPVFPTRYDDINISGSAMSHNSKNDHDIITSLNISKQHELVNSSNPVTQRLNSELMLRREFYLASMRNDLNPSFENHEENNSHSTIQTSAIGILSHGMPVASLGNHIDNILGSTTLTNNLEDQSLQNKNSSNSDVIRSEFLGQVTIPIPKYYL